MKVRFFQENIKHFYYILNVIINIQTEIEFSLHLKEGKTLYWKFWQLYIHPWGYDLLDLRGWAVDRGGGAVFSLAADWVSLWEDGGLYTSIEKGKWYEWLDKIGKYVFSSSESKQMKVICIHRPLYRLSWYHLCCNSLISATLLPGISCGQKSSQAGHRGSVLPLKYLATQGVWILMPHVGFSHIWHWEVKRPDYYKNEAWNQMHCLESQAISVVSIPFNFRQQFE